MAAVKLLSYGIPLAKLFTPSPESTEPFDANIIKKYDNPKSYVCVLEEVPKPEDTELRLENIPKSNIGSTDPGIIPESEYPKFSEEKLAKYAGYVKEMGEIVSKKEKDGYLDIEKQIDRNESNGLEKLKVMIKKVNGNMEVTIIYTDYIKEGYEPRSNINKDIAIHRGVSISFTGSAFELRPPKLGEIPDAFDKFGKDDFELLDEMLGVVKSHYTVKK